MTTAQGIKHVEPAQRMCVRSGFPNNAIVYFQLPGVETESESTISPPPVPLSTLAPLPPSPWLHLYTPVYRAKIWTVLLCLSCRSRGSITPWFEWSTALPDGRESWSKRWTLRRGRRVICCRFLVAGGGDGWIASPAINEDLREM